MHLTTCDLKILLGMAKAAHSKLPKAILDHPHHSWEDWYAQFIMAKLKEVDYTEAFAPIMEASGISCNTAWQATNGNGPAEGCPPGPAQECTDALMYKAADEQEGRFDPASPPSPASAWR